MKNSQIIFNEQLKLMNDGIIGTTGKQITVTNEKGEKFTVNEPEPIHTFATWKALGFSVKKGQHAIAQIYIWKHVSKPGTLESKDENGDPVSIEYDDSKMFMKKAFFFKLSQVEKADGKKENKPATETKPEPKTDPAPEPAKPKKAASKTDIEKAVETLNKIAQKEKFSAVKSGTFENTAYITDGHQLLKTTACTTESKIEKFDVNTYENILKATKDFTETGSVNLSAKELKDGIKELKAGKRNTKVVYTTSEGIVLNANYLLNAITATGTTVYRHATKNEKKQAVILENNETSYMILPINSKVALPEGLSVIA